MDPERAEIAAQELRLGVTGARVSFHGHSMRPFLHDGDDLGVEPVTFADVRVGDIITCRLDARFPTLRVMSRSPTKLRLRGDGWPFADFDAWPDDVVARVTSRHRGTRTVTPTSWSWRSATLRALADDTLRQAKRSGTKRSQQITAGVMRRARRVLSGGADQPAGIHVNISASCNLSCRMCPYLEVHDDSGYDREMTEDTFRHIMPALKTVKSVTFAGSGEPLFNRRAISFLEMARTVNPTIETGLTTNGTLVTERVARELVAAGLSRIVFSIDGATEATVSAIRRGVNLSKVLANVRTLADVKVELASATPTIIVNYVIGYGSYEELPLFVRGAKALGIQEVHVLEILTGSAEAAATSLFASMAKDGGRVVREAKRVADAAGIVLKWPTTLNNKCLHPSTPHFSESGALSPCCYVDYEGRTLWDDNKAMQFPHVDYGNITTESFEAIWRRPAFQEFRDRNSRGDFPDFCRTCHSVRAATSAALHTVLE